ncbi:electron transporter [Microbacterium aurantiacum]|uniref:RNA polymerase-binding protein RbpA n=2 Tax=Microbacterium aurantiacum TaxID=162393 RepID=A0A0M8MH17_9MICO|nr:electron transporter [Microbacterium chocolatum]
MGEQDHGFHADRVAVSYWDALGNETVRYFAAGIPDEEIPETIDSPHSGLPAGRDKDNPPALAKTEPYKTHLAYVKERRTEEEAEALLDDALAQLRDRRGSVVHSRSMSSGGTLPAASSSTKNMVCLRPLAPAAGTLA